MGRQIDPTWVNETETRASERDDLLIYHHHIEPRRALFPDPRVPDSVAGDMGDDVTATGNIVEGSSVGAGSGTPPGVPGGGGGGFRIPKVASSQAPGAGGGSAASPAAGAPAPPPRPPSDPSHPPAFPPGAPRDDRYDRGPSGATATTAAAADEDRKRRVHKGTRRHRHMLVLDLNGLLVDRRMSPFENPVDGTKVAPDAKFGKFYIYNRPHMQSFVEWASEHFTVGVWSSAQHHNARTLVNHIWGKQRDRLAFVWGQDRCTHVGAMDPAATGPNHRSKPILLKDLNALWAVSSYARFGPNNTLLLDDSPYKAVMNPAHTAIHPAEYKLSWGGADVNVTGEESDANDHRRIADELLGPNGALRTYLAKLSECETVTAYVAANPWRSFGPAAPDSDPGLMAKAREGGEAVAAAAAATATAGGRCSTRSRWCSGYPRPRRGRGASGTGWPRRRGRRTPAASSGRAPSSPRPPPSRRPCTWCRRTGRPSSSRPTRRAASSGARPSSPTAPPSSPHTPGRSRTRCRTSRRRTTRGTCPGSPSSRTWSASPASRASGDFRTPASRTWTSGHLPEGVGTSAG